jgi:hypothetical protein
MKEYLEYVEIWLAPLPAVPGLNKRAEAAILEHLRGVGGAAARLVDGNRSLVFARSDRKFALTLRSSRKLYGFPEMPLTA